MPVKGYWTTTGVVLFERAPSIESLARSLGFGWEELPAQPSKPGEPAGWIFGGPSIATTLAHGVRAIVDVVDRPWPDDMGHPQHDPDVFGGWVMGQFGSTTYPQALLRAIGNARFLEDAEGVLEGRAGAFVRIRASYAVARGMDTPILPPDGDLLRDAIDVLRIAQRLLGVEGALAWFSPGGEVVASKAAIDTVLGRASRGGHPPIEAWIGVRAYPLPGTDLVVMDTVGAEQLERTDLEVLARADDLDPDSTYSMLMGLTAQRLRGADAIPAETVGVAGGPEFRHQEIEESIGAPPRRVIRLTRNDRPPVSPTRH